MTTETWTITGEKAEKASLPQSVFGVKVDKKLLAQAVKMFLANKRKANAKTKTRSEVAKTTAKMYRQKGTGRARHGSYSAPIFVGGGVAHGPDGRQNYKQSLPAQIKKLALAEALSAKAADKQVVIITGGDKAKGKTKEIAKLVKKAGWTGSMLAVGTKEQKMWARSWKNIGQVSTVTVGQINVYEVLANKLLVITAEAVKEIGKNYAN